MVAKKKSWLEDTADWLKEDREPKYDSAFREALRPKQKKVREPRLEKEPVKRSINPGDKIQCWMVRHVAEHENSRTTTLHKKSADEIFESCTSVKLFYFNDEYNDIIINWNNIYEAIPYFCSSHPRELEDGE